MIPWLLVSVLVLIILLAVVFVLRMRHRGHGHMPPVDYYGWFVIGCVWSIVGIIGLAVGGRDNGFFLVMGIAFCIGGLLHRGKWKENRRSWANMDKKGRRHRMIMIVSSAVLGFLVAVLVVIGLLRG